ncbi:hypothetical protein KFU94_24350 [Chloroflexi bacterium TSY]|nr:hypothetical protein [Chloroflexi bacterium TSY]
MLRLLLTREVSAYLDDNFGYANDVLLLLKSIRDIGIPPDGERIAQADPLIYVAETNQHWVFYRKLVTQNAVVVESIKPKPS